MSPLLCTSLVFLTRFFWLFLFLEKIKSHLQTKFERLTLLETLMSLVCSPVLDNRLFALVLCWKHRVLADVGSFMLHF